MTARENLSAGTRVRPDTRGGFVIPDMRQEFLAERDDLFVVHDFLAPEECDDYTTLSESVGFGDAPITTSGGPVMRKDIRNNDRVMIDDPRIAATIWDRLRLFMPERVQF